MDLIGQLHRRLLLRRSLIIIAATISTPTSSAVDFLFNGFAPPDMSLYGNATIDSQILTLTNDTTFSIGRALYPSKIPTKQPNGSRVSPFSTSFIFAMAPYKGRLPGHGIVFLFAPHAGIEGTTSSQNLGLFNLTNNGDSNNHVFGVEFDVFKNEEFKDIDANHVGIDVNSLISVASYEAGYWDDGGNFKALKLNTGENYQVWIDYDGGVVNVTMARLGMSRPRKPLLNVSIDLSEVLEEETYVGFTASTGALVESHKILGWSFSNDNFSYSKGLITRGLPSFELPEPGILRRKGAVLGLVFAALCVVTAGFLVAFLLVRRRRRVRREREEMEEWEFEYWPHRIAYREVESAANFFSEDNVIGVGGNGKVYKGILPGGTEIAVKRILHDGNELAVRTFLNEISSLGRLRHRNLVGLRGWCKKEKGSLIIVYDYMENGSLDARIFDPDDEEKGTALNCGERIRILKQVASGILYLHEGWESKVLHRDIKASNVLLDREMNARLGDFGIAKVHDHDKAAGTTRVVGTVGYLAPEIVRSGRISAQSDVFGYGVLILEVLCGRRPLEPGEPPLVDWVWELMRRDELIGAVDARLRIEPGFDEEEVVRMLHLGLLCTIPEPKLRPSMRQIVKLFEGGAANEAVDEGEGEDMMGVYLLEKMKRRDIWFMYPHGSGPGLGSGLHPTF